MHVEKERSWKSRMNRFQRIYTNETEIFTVPRWKEFIAISPSTTLKQILILFHSFLLILWRPKSFLTKSLEIQFVWLMHALVAQ